METIDLTKKQKLKILKKAKKMHIKGMHTGMCSCLEHAVLRFIIEKLEQDPHLYGFKDFSYDYLQNIFPEFNSVDLTGRYFGEFKYWWPVEDSQSRVDAFDKLIKIYSTKKIK